MKRRTNDNQPILRSLAGLPVARPFAFRGQSEEQAEMRFFVRLGFNDASGEPGAYMEFPMRMRDDDPTEMKYFNASGSPITKEVFDQLFTERL